MTLMIRPTIDQLVFYHYSIIESIWKNYLWPALWMYGKLSAWVNVWFPKTTFHTTCSLHRPGQIARPTPIGKPQNFWDTPDFSGAHVLPGKKKNHLNLKVFSWIGKTIKKLQWIINTIMNTSVLEWFGNVHISDGVKTALSTHGLRNI